MTKIVKGKNIFMILGFAFILRIILSPFGTLTLDQNTFIAWSMRLSQVGLTKFYFGTWSDYLPGYLYALDLLGQIAKTHLIPEMILYKLPGIISDIGTGYLIYKITAKLKNSNWGKITACLYLFNLAIIANSTLWGQVDGLIAFFSLLALWTLDTNLFLSSIALAIGTLIKPQMAILSLVIFMVMIARKWKLSKIIIYVITSFLVFVAGFVPFSNGNNLANFILQRMNISLNQYPYTSVNAFNFWAILGLWKPDVYLNIIGGIVVLILILIFGIKFLKQKGGEYILLAFAYAASFLFMTRMHERHMLPLFAPLTIAVSLNPVFIFALIGFSFIYIANLYWAWNWVTNNFKIVFDDFIVKMLSIINVLLISVFLMPEKIQHLTVNFENSFLRSRKTSWPVTSFSGSSPVFERAKISSQKIKILFLCTVIFASVTRFYNLNSPTGHYFDEVYHAFTAQNMLHGITRAWEWWNPNPTGFAYEWTHPPLAKELMAVGMKLLGESAFGWRIPGAILGVGSVILVYFLAKEIFQDELLGLIASATFALDGLPLVLSRIGMNDSYMLFFALASVLTYLKKKNFLAAIFLGLALASKWSALWIIPIIIILHFALKRKFKASYIFFFIIPPLIYISTYFPLFTNKQIQSEYVANTYYETRTDKIGIIPLDMFVDTQKQMWWYHTGLKATHAYSSMWYTWPIMIRPIYLYTSNEVDNTVSRIYAMGNPIVFWAGIVSIGFMLFNFFRERNKRVGLLVFCYLIFFTPWALSPRIMFLYHYLPSVPFMAMGIAYVLRRHKEFLLPFFIFAAISFVYFYPHFIGLKIPLALDTSYYWFTSWR